MHQTRIVGAEILENSQNRDKQRIDIEEVDGRANEEISLNSIDDGGDEEECGFMCIENNAAVKELNDSCAQVNHLTNGSPVNGFCGESTAASNTVAEIT